MTQKINQYKTQTGAEKKYNKELKFYNNLHSEKRKRWMVFKPKLEKDEWGFYYVTYWS